MSRHEGPHRDERPGPVVIEIFGYSQIALIMNTYSHVALEVSREAADRIARMLWQISGDDGNDHQDNGE